MENKIIDFPAEDIANEQNITENVEMETAESVSEEETTKDNNSDVETEESNTTPEMPDMNALGSMLGGAQSPDYSELLKLCIDAFGQFDKNGENFKKSIDAHENKIHALTFFIKTLLATNAVSIITLIGIIIYLIIH